MTTWTRCNNCMAEYMDEVSECRQCWTDAYLMDIPSVWTKYDYVCTHCDALIEITAKTKPQLDPDCTCGIINSIIQIGATRADVSKVTA